MKIPSYRAFYGKFVYLRNIFRRGLTMKGKVKFKGRPTIRIIKGGQVILGNNVTINSSNKFYHVNMYGRVKLYADERGAKIEVGDETRIHGSCLHAKKRISIGKRCLIAANCNIIDSNGHDASFNDTSNRINTIGTYKEVIIEDDVWIGLGSTILPGVKIGKGSIIGASSVVNQDIPEKCIAAGNPAKVIKKA